MNNLASPRVFSESKIGGKPHFCNAPTQAQPRRILFTPLRLTSWQQLVKSPMVYHGTRRRSRRRHRLAHHDVEPDAGAVARQLDGPLGLEAEALVQRHVHRAAALEVARLALDVGLSFR